MHTPQELAAMNDCTDILRYLDGIASKQELDDPKKVKKQQELADKDAQKLIKNFKEVQKKADKKSKKKEKDIEQEIKKMEIREEDGELDGADRLQVPSGAAVDRRGSVATTKAMSFSDMVGMAPVNNGSNTSSVKSNGSSSTGSTSVVSEFVKAPNLGKALKGTIFKKAQSKKASIIDTGFKVKICDILIIGIIFQLNVL